MTYDAKKYEQTEFIKSKPIHEVLRASKYEGNNIRARGKNGIAIMKLKIAGNKINSKNNKRGGSKPI